ncbi:MAG: hypothetical protein ACLFUO_02920, partial [Candidatus Woesearchaeota archaeon]
PAIDPNAVCKLDGQLLLNVPENECEYYQRYCEDPGMRLATKNNADFVCCHQDRIYDSDTKCCDGDDVALTNDKNICCDQDRLYDNGDECCPNSVVTTNSGTFCCAENEELFANDNSQSRCCPQDTSYLSYDGTTCCQDGDTRSVCERVPEYGPCQCVPSVVSSADEPVTCSAKVDGSDNEFVTEETIPASEFQDIESEQKKYVFRDSEPRCEVVIRSVDDDSSFRCDPESCTPLDVELRSGESIRVICDIVDENSVYVAKAEKEITGTQITEDNSLVTFANEDYPDAVCAVSVKKIPPETECECEPNPVIKGRMVTCNIYIDEKLSFVERVSTSSLNPGTDVLVPTDNGECRVNIEEEDDESCIPDGYNGECPDHCRSWEDPDCDYGRTGLIMTNFISETLFGSSLQGWWNSRLQANGWESQVFSFAQNIPLTPEWISDQVCKQGSSIGDSFDNLFFSVEDDYEGDEDEDWVPPDAFLDPDIAITFGAEYDGTDYKVSWIFNNFEEGEDSLFRIILKNEYGVTDSEERDIFPAWTNDPEITWEDFYGDVPESVSELPYPVEKFDNEWAPVLNGKGNYIHRNEPQNYDTICMHIRGKKLEIFGDFPVFDEVKCRSISRTY